MPKAQIHIPASSIDFLKALKQNNNRDWFNAHKSEYLEQQLLMEAFADALLAKMNEHDVIETPTGKRSMHRIYKDTRFSKDKTPYKTNFSGSFTRATKLRRGGYYFHIEPGNSFVAGGFWAPNAADLKRVRDDIAYDAAPLRKILNTNAFKETFDTLQGEQLKTAPKGFDTTNEAIDLLRYKQFLLVHNFTDKEVLATTFLEQANRTFKTMRRFLDYMSDVLATDVNGEAV